MAQSNNHAFSPVLKDIKEKALEQTKEAREKIDAHAHEKPWFYVGFVALLSGMLGFLFGRKSK
jgi:ElaB/YqjD/DUF883 family membrane-anchored ribosome-binding protein